MIAYKLMRKMSDGSLASLFIGLKRRYEIGTWYNSEFLPTRGFAVRQGFHCTLKPEAPHLMKTKLNNRVWVKVEVEDYEFFDRPESQGGKWVLADTMKILEVLE